MRKKEASDSLTRGWLEQELPLLEMWRSVTGPYAQLTGPLIRYAALVHSAALEAAQQRIQAQDAEITELRRARTGDSEIIGRWMCQAEAAEARLSILQERIAELEDFARRVADVYTIDSDQVAVLMLVQEAREMGLQRAGAARVATESSGSHGSPCANRDGGVDADNR